MRPCFLEQIQWDAFRLEVGNTDSELSTLTCNGLQHISNPEFTESELKQEQQSYFEQKHLGTKYVMALSKELF